MQQWREQWSRWAWSCWSRGCRGRIAFQLNKKEVDYKDLLVSVWR